MKSYDQRLKVLVLSIIGLFLSIELLIHHVRVNYGFQILPSSCVINSFLDCDSVAKSSFAQIGNLPIAAIGAAYFLALICLIIGSVVIEGAIIANILLLLSSIALVCSLIMAAISVFYLQKVCVNCSLEYATNLAIFIIAFISKQRDRRIVSAMKSACAATIAFCRAVFSSDHPLRGYARLALCLLVFIGSSALFSQAFIIQYYSEARIKQARANAPKIEEIIRQWQSQPTKQLQIYDREEFLKKDFVYGAIDAPVTLVEFSDYQCPFCREVGLVLKEIVRQSGGRLRLVIKNYPLDKSCNNAMQRPLHDFACLLAVAARCAGEQREDSFWQAYELINKTKDGYLDLLSNFSKVLNLEEDRYSSCTKNPSVLEKITDDIEEGNLLGVQRTPTIYVNGKLLMVSSIDVLKKVLAEIIKQSN